MVLEKHSIQERESKMKKEAENGCGFSEAEQSIEVKTDAENVMRHFLHYVASSFIFFVASQTSVVANGRCTPVDGELNGSKSDEGSVSVWQAEFEKSLTEDRPVSSGSGDYGFNDEILCVHGELDCYATFLALMAFLLVEGNLNVEESTRKAIPAAVWEIFRNYFPDAVEYSTGEAPCRQCTVNAPVDTLPHLLMSRRVFRLR